MEEVKKFKNLDKTYKEILYAASGFGPNLMMVLMGGFFTDAINPSALDLNTNPGKIVQTISGSCLIIPWLFSILWFVSKSFDGIIDIPFASITDNLKTKWGRRRLPIAICFLPMVVSYILCWVPISKTNMLVNTIWIIVFALIFFATYTMNLISFYGSMSTVCYDEKQRLKVSSLKSFFDTISYVIVYALVPLILSLTKLHINQLVYILSPLMLTMIIPLFIIKEGDKWEEKAISEGYDITPLKDEKKLGILESIKLTFKNKPFIRWCIVNCCSFFGLQMFLVSMNALILGGMGLTSTHMAILNTAAFAPVPIMLYLFNKLKKKKGIRFAFQTCLISFAVSILSFDVGSRYLMGDNLVGKMIIGIIGSLLGSWAIGAFFMMPYLIPSQISSVEEKLTGKNHSAMYFAAQAVTTSIIGAIASSFVYENIKTLFISKGSAQIVYATDSVDSTTGVITSAAENASSQLGVSLASVYNLGTLLVPIIVSLFCIIGFIFSFKMPKDYSPRFVAKELKLEKEYEEKKDLFPIEKEFPFERESLVINNALWLLSASIFSFIWNYQLLVAINSFTEEKIKKRYFIISIFLFPLSAYLNIKLNNQVDKRCKELEIKCISNKTLIGIFSALGLSFLSLSLIQNKVNLIADKVNVS